MESPYLQHLNDPSGESSEQPTNEQLHQMIKGIQGQLQQLVTQLTRIETKVNQGSPPQ